MQLHSQDVDNIRVDGMDAVHRLRADANPSQGEGKQPGKNRPIRGRDQKTRHLNPFHSLAVAMQDISIILTGAEPVFKRILLKRKKYLDPKLIEARP